MASLDDPEGSIVSQDTTTTTSFALEDHIRKPQQSEPTHKGKNRLFYYAYCSWSRQSTTNTRQHLLRKYDIALEAAIRTARVTISQTTKLDSQVLKKVLNKDAINSALLSLIVVRNLPFRLIESKEFHIFCKILNLEAQNLISSYSILRSQIAKSWIIHKDIVRKKL
ncbi:hypothetical protein B0T24DRAFT_609885 [Lasiosphaeria ovina]|uniref:Uncharacterized protein n=1 Tax=Lasiosphaeria ovina TaxID=92902 RepID=A0AAE0KM51_9PEZI|nr:hypothetical protein B0T24DRAFT_609885 [Lasiosphaeria ovina]